MKNIFNEDELDENSVVNKKFITASDGKNYNVSHYNLDAIISIGYRVNSHRATQFQIWATNALKESMLKDFAMDDDCLKKECEGLRKGITGFNKKLKQALDYNSKK